ncbi:hypothetical protein K504DRAFT_54887 [Pleomassaria siparia CBS 279.74]|uniref:Uncharacterized protein n=1 Tax=Pleomassaria siparia CBS 279.74 TaxID=1314801 RepID=A0A6G1K487_9PLEO|nr:hypothetical protein K504DRAFT_54887 [Pleomassaria siparia CBS 279.74]
MRCGVLLRPSPWGKISMLLSAAALIGYTKHREAMDHHEDTYIHMYTQYAAAKTFEAVCPLLDIIGGINPPVKLNPLPPSANRLTYTFCTATD